MSGRKNVLRYQLETAKSLASAFQTEPTLITFLDNVSYQINIDTSDSEGSFKVQVSDDYDISEPTDTVINPGTWVDLPLSGNPVAEGQDDSIVIDMNQMSFTAVRLAYTPSVAGTGTCSVLIIARQLGG